jgi:hypothetical protein
MLAFHIRNTGVALATALALAAGVARAETIELVDKTKLNAKIVHYYDGVYTVETNGQTMKLPREKIRAISFQAPPARPEFSTPEKTFDRWRKALADGAAEKIIDCYALMYQGMKKMQKEIEGTKFQIKESKTKGDTATLKVLRQKGDESDTGEVAFVKENGEWKMLPPQ